MEELTTPQTDEADPMLPLGGDPSPDGEHAFVIEVRSNSSGALDGFVLHLSTGRREPVQEWEDVARVIRGALWTGNDPIDSDGA